LPARQRLIDRGSARGRAIVADLAREAEAARLQLGLSYTDIARALGIDRTQVARICRGQSPDLTVVRAAELLTILGLELGAKAYPGGAPLRDAAQVALLERFRARLGSGLRWRAEVPVVAIPGTLDRRAWDGAIEAKTSSAWVEAETALRDAQAVLRRIALKQRDSGNGRVVLLVSDTDRNRRAIQAAERDFRSAFPGLPRAALRALRTDQLPTENVLLVL
jgi:transcriptional regulator with XRE-family HTH domain